ncbi:MAG: L-threonine 3-dehydrogenase [Chthonomonas sp.]|nr:L-threonine 3-dehydrogenase [Chthonomonas sp.]
MQAIAKTRSAAGLDLIEVEPAPLGPGEVRLRVEHGSVCGTDLHIYNWDAWSSARIKPVRIVGHEFCGTIIEVGPGVSTRKVGDYVASESHIVCGKCPRCLEGQGHICENTVILGVDVDGGFRPETVIPADNARLVPSEVPRNVASMLDALGNGVHTAMEGPVEDRVGLITGLGPIGLFGVAICRALGARKIYATEISDYRIKIAEELGVDVVLNPMKVDVAAELRRLEPKGVDFTLEMSGHPTALPLAIEATRPGGRVSMLGVYPGPLPNVDLNAAIFKGIVLQGIVGRKIWDTWHQMAWLLTEKKLNVLPVVTHQMPFTDFEEAMTIMKAGKAGKIVLDF